MTRTEIVAFCRKHGIALEVRLRFLSASPSLPVCVFRGGIARIGIRRGFGLARLVADITVGALQAWAALVRGLRFRHSTIVALAEKYGKDPAHVLLRWSLQKARDIVPVTISELN